MEINKSIEQGFAGGGLHDILTQLKNGMLPISGETYYVSKFGNNTTGLSWENAFTTIAGAIAASNTYIAVTANSYGRNRMYIDGGNLWAETLAILPNQCDMIGVGARTGWRPTIYGRTNITTAVLGCHIYNIMFYNPTNSVPVVTILAGSHGIEFHKCQIANGDGVSSTIGLQLGSMSDLVVNDCSFTGNPPSVIGIQLDGTSAVNGRIINNMISATTTGIAIADLTTSDYGLLIKDNVITRCDPNSDQQLAVGISFLDDLGGCRTHAMVVRNYISAADGIAFAAAVGNNRDHWMCIGNIICVTTGSIYETTITTP